VDRDDNWRAWILLVVMLAVHVWDELISGFLPFYNQVVIALRRSLGFFPMPTFSPEVWIAGLTVLVVTLLLMVQVVERGGRAIRWFAGLLSIVMIGNGLGHLAGSLYLGWWLPGATSSPLLLASAIWMLQRVRTGAWTIAV
jgi:hypothetical protein